MPRRRRSAGLARYRARSATATSSSFSVASSGNSAVPGADRDRRPDVLGQPHDRGADPLDHLAHRPARDARQEHGELVAAVAVDAVPIPQRAGHRGRDPSQQRVALGVAVPVVVGLERVEVQHQQPERLLACDQQPDLALERAVVAQAGERVVLGLGHHGPVRLGVAEGDRGLRREQLDQLELVLAEVRLDPAHAREVEGADDVARTEQRAHEHRLGLLGRARDLERPVVEMGVVGEHGLAAVDRPAGDPRIQRALVLEDHLRVAVAGEHGAPHLDRAVDAVDGQGVVRDHDLERVGDHLEHAARVEGGEQALVDLEQPALALEAVVQLVLLAADLPERLGVDHRLGRVAGEDLERPLVVLAELVVANLGHDDHAEHPRLVRHRHQQHRLHDVVRAELDAARVGARVAEADGLVVLRNPAGQALTGPEPQHLAVERADPRDLAVVRDRLAHPGHRVDGVDPDGVVADQPVGLGHDRVADLLDVLDPVEPGRELLDGAQPRGALADRREQPRVRERRRHLVRERGAQLELVGGPVVRGAVVEHQQPDVVVAEQQRDEVDGPEPEPFVDRAEAGGRGGVRDHDRPPLAHRAQPHDVLVLVHGRDDVDELLAQVAARDQLERLAARLELPQAGGIGAEQLLRGIEDVLEHGVDLERAADLGHDAAQGDRPCLLRAGVSGSPRASRGAGSPGRCAVVQGDCHATGRGYPLRALRLPRGTGGHTGCVGRQRTRAWPGRTIGRSYQRAAGLHEWGMAERGPVLAAASAPAQRGRGRPNTRHRSRPTMWRRSPAIPGSPRATGTVHSARCHSEWLTDTSIADRGMWCPDQGGISAFRRIWGTRVVGTT